MNLSKAFISLTNGIRSSLGGGEGGKVLGPYFRFQWMSVGIRAQMVAKVARCLGSIFLVSVNKSGELTCGSHGWHTKGP